MYSQTYEITHFITNHVKDGHVYRSSNAMTMFIAMLIFLTICCVFTRKYCTWVKNDKDCDKHEDRIKDRIYMTIPNVICEEWVGDVINNNNGERIIKKKKNYFQTHTWVFIKR